MRLWENGFSFVKCISMWLFLRDLAVLYTKAETTFSKGFVRFRNPTKYVSAQATLNPFLEMKQKLYLDGES